VIPVEASQAPAVPVLGRSVSIEHAARLLDVSRRTIYNRIREGRLRTVRTLGGSQRVLVESLRELADPRAVLAGAGPTPAVRS
jgi:excisionase family DNA binding protein